MPKFDLEHIFKYLEIERLHDVDDVRWPAPEIVPVENGSQVAARQTAGETDPILLSEVVAYPIREMGIVGFHRIYNRLITARLQPGELACTMFLPENNGTTEKICAQAESDLQRLCDRNKIGLKSIQKNIYPVVADPLILLEMIARKKPGTSVPPENIEAGMRIVLANPLAGLPISFLSALYPSRIADVFDPLFLKLCQDMKLENLISLRKFARMRKDLWAYHHVTLPAQFGISTCCYAIGQNSGLGIEIKLEAIPMLVPAKILCDLFRLDPLCTDSTGSVLIVCDNPAADRLVEACLEKNIIAAQIGEITDKHNSCTFINPEGETVKMYKPACDELLRYRFKS